MAEHDPHQSSTTIPVVEEVINVDKRSYVTGRTRVSTRTETIEDNVAAKLDTQHVNITRVPIGRDLSPDEPAPAPRQEGETLILPVLEEYLVVEKRLRLVEEVHITQTTSVEDVDFPISRRRQVSEITHEDTSRQDAIHKPV